MRAESSLEELLPNVNKAVDGVLRRRRKDKDFADDFRAWVMLKMLERDCAILKRFRGESTLLTYLRVVVNRLYCDYLISLNGKWRSSKKVLESELRDDFSKIPSRRTRFFIGLDSLPELPADARSSAYDILRQKEIDHTRRMIRDVLADALAELPEEDRLILELRFCRGLRISALSRQLGLKQRSVYSRFYRILRALREKLEAREVRGNTVRDMAEGSFVPQEIEGAFAGAAARCVSSSMEPEMLFETCREPFLRTTENFSMSV